MPRNFLSASFLQHFKKEELHTTPRFSKEITNIIETHKKTHDFFAKKDQIFIYFILEGVKFYQSQYTADSSKKFTDEMEEYADGKNLSDPIGKVTDLLESYSYEIFYLLYSIHPTFSLNTDLPLLPKILDYLFNLGIEQTQDLDMFLSPDIHDKLIENLLLS